MTHAEALAILDELCRRLDGKRASTNRTRKRSPNQAAANPAWWTAHSGTSPPWDGERTVAYLSAYVRVSGPRFPLTGIVLDDGYIWPDRAVMRCLLDARCVRVSRSQFMLTDKGRALIAPMVRLNAHT